MSHTVKLSVAKLVIISNVSLILGCSEINDLPPGKDLQVSAFTDTDYPQIEPAYNYDFGPPVAADILSEDPSAYQPTYTKRYFTSIFGPRYKSVSSSNVGYFDFHQGMDLDAEVSHNGNNYNKDNPPAILSRCDGEISEITEGPDEELEKTDGGRWVEVGCNQEFNGNNWGPVYMAYRHLKSITEGLKKGDKISKGDIIGIMGESGHTTNVHLHYSVMRRNEGRRINVNPMRTFDPKATPHLHSFLNDDVEISQLYHARNTALLRVTVPHQQTALRALTVSLEGHDYIRTYDFEKISKDAGDQRDQNNYVKGLALFAYSYNRGQSGYTRYLSTRNSMPQAYPASTKNPAENLNPILSNGLNTEPAYNLDVLVSDLPDGFSMSDLKIELIDIYGYGVYAYGDDAAGHNSVVFSQINAENDAAEEAEDGTMNLESSDLALGQDNSRGKQKVGLRFPSVKLPNSANIHLAYIQFSADETNAEETHLTIHAENSDASTEFTTNDFNISQRNTTDEHIQWQPEAWNTKDEISVAQKTPDLTDIIQSVVNREGWTKESALSFIISGTGKRVADAFSVDYGGRNTPHLYIEYSESKLLNALQRVWKKICPEGVDECL